jgi:hypothetical protein
MLTVEMFLILLTFFSIVTGLVTEATKKLFDEMGWTYASNLVVLCVAVIVGGFGTLIYYLLVGYQWNAPNIISIFLMMIANWLGAMVGYDKIKQAITQFKGL